MSQSTPPSHQPNRGTEEHSAAPADFNENYGAFDLLATSTFGLEAIVARELAELGYDAKPVGTGRILFRGDARAIVRANLWLRAADRVLVRVGGFPVGGGDAGFDALFEGVRGLPWERWIGPTMAFPVQGRCVRSQLSSEPAVQRATKRAIVERLRAAHGVSELPETGPTVAVEVSILKDVATLTIDTSGAGLHKRGYREGTPGEAALKETMAAGLVLLSVWRPGRPLVDPFCGSGTIAIEAAMIGRRIAPGLKRSFDAEQWGGVVPQGLWSEERAAAEAAALPGLNPTIHASDIDERALRIARANARAAGVERDIHFAKRDVAELASRLEYGCIVTNPPYGVRLGEEAEVERMYRSLPAVFRRLPTWSFHILTGRLDLERLFGQQAGRRRKLYNSKIECCYFTFLGPRPPGEQQPREREFDAVEFDEGDAPEEVGAETGVEEAAAERSGEGASAAESPSAASGGKAAPATIRPPLTARPSPPAMPAFGGLRQRDEKEAAEFSRCLTNNLRHLRKYPSRGITCYRIYERDVPDVPLIVDRYEDHYHAVEYERQHSRTVAQQADWFDLMRRTIAEAAGVPVDHVFTKEKHRQRGLTQHEKKDESGHRLVVQEGGLKFEVNLADYVDTGLFLDHRLTRGMVREQAAGKRVLNLFCYTGAFTVYAAAGGATATTSVDLSNTYIDWARRNLELNGLTSPQHRFDRSDVFEFLAYEGEAVVRRRAKLSAAGDGGGGGGGGAGAYDLAIIDPPTFSNSKSTEEDWQVAERHVELLTGVAPLMSQGGVVYLSTNYRRFKLDEGALAELGFAAANISRRTVPPEYRNRRIHQCWRLTVTDPKEATAALERRRAAAPSSGSQRDEEPDEGDEMG